MSRSDSYRGICIGLSMFFGWVGVHLLLSHTTPLVAVVVGVLLLLSGLLWSEV